MLSLVNLANAAIFHQDKNLETEGIRLTVYNAASHRTNCNCFD